MPYQSGPTKLTLLATLLVPASLSATTLTLPVLEDVMTSGFFQGTNQVRGYSEDGRDTHRISSPAPFGASDETVYLSFDPASFSSLSSPVFSATLVVYSVAGGFNADGSATTPFTASAHGVISDPLTTILDDTNLTGTLTATEFRNSSILPADSAAFTQIDAVDVEIEFDVTDLINDWISGANSVPTVALTGLNETSGTDFLHGIINNSATPGSSYLVIETVPEPSAALLGLLGSGLLFLRRSRR